MNKKGLRIFFSIEHENLSVMGLASFLRNQVPL